MTRLSSGAEATSATASIGVRLTALADELAGLFDALPAGSLRVDDAGFITSINPLACAWLGSPAAELLGRRRPLEFFTPASQERLVSHSRASGPRGFRGLQLELRSSQGGLRPVRLSCTPEPGSANALGAHRALMIDLSAANERQLTQRMVALSRDTPIASCITDADGLIVLGNAALAQLTGVPLLGLRRLRLPELASGERSRSFLRAVWQEELAQGHWRGEFTDRHSDGRAFTAWMTVDAAGTRQGRPSRYLVSLHDITEQRTAISEVQHLSRVDPLTQLPNRRRLREWLGEAHQKALRQAQQAALVIIDLDHFRIVNDTLGHEVGDRLLREAARRLHDAVLPGERLASLGGDEFSLLLEGLGPEAATAAHQARARAEGVMAVLGQPWHTGAQDIITAASLGVALSGGEQTAAAWLQQADLALLEAKQSGRNTVRLFQPQLLVAAQRQAQVEQELRPALLRREFELHYQPQFDASRRIVAVEALLRWRHPRRGLVQPGAFIAEAEASGLIVPLGQWIVEQACAQLAAWRGSAAASRLHLAVNVSARQLAQADFVAHLRAALASSGAPPALLCLELTETTVHDVEDTRQKLEALRALGVRFAMDDFGIGHSSLSRLINLPLAVLKIDRSFVKDMAHSRAAGVVVKTIVGIADRLGLQVVAEGVETEAQLQALVAEGCTQFQGYLLSRAVPAEELMDLLARNPR